MTFLVSKKQIRPFLVLLLLARQVLLQHPRLGDGEVPPLRDGHPRHQRAGDGGVQPGRLTHVRRRQVQAADWPRRPRLGIIGDPGRIRVLLLHRRRVHQPEHGRPLPAPGHRN